MLLAFKKQSQEDQKFNFPLLLSDFEARLDYTEEEGGGREVGAGGWGVEGADGDK